MSACAQGTMDTIDNRDAPTSPRSIFVSISIFNCFDKPIHWLAAVNVPATPDIAVVPLICLFSRSTVPTNDATPEPPIGVYADAAQSNTIRWPLTDPVAIPMLFGPLHVPVNREPACWKKHTGFKLMGLTPGRNLTSSTLRNPPFTRLSVINVS